MRPSPYTTMGKFTYRACEDMCGVWIWARGIESIGILEESAVSLFASIHTTKMTMSVQMENVTQVVEVRGALGICGDFTLG